MHKQKMRFIFNGILAGLLAVLFMVPVVYAQDEDSDTFMLEEVTVTAEKRDTNLQKTPISIQTVSGVELTQEAKTRIDDIMQGVVGVQTQGSQVGVDFFMRGLGTPDAGPPVGGANQSAVAVLIDGIYQNRGEVVRGGTLDMAQAEVMRGTQSTTLGGSSLAGAVSLVSNNPVFDYEGSGSLGFGDYNLLTTQAVVNVPLSEDQAFRIAYSTEKRDGYVSSNAGNSDQANGRIKYRYQPTETFDLVATISKQVIGGNGVDTGALSYYGYWEAYDPASAGLYDATIGYPILYGHINNGVKYDDRDNPWDDGLPFEGWPNNVFRHTNIYQYSVNMDYDLGFSTLTVTPSYQTAEFNSQEAPRASQSESEMWNAEQRDQETVQFDLQLTSSPDAPFEWLGGVYYYDTEFSGEMYSANFNNCVGPDCPPGPPPAPDAPEGDYYNWESTNPSGQTTYAAYANLTYPVLDVLRINAGARYTKDEKFERKTMNRLYGFTKPSGFVYDSDNKADWDATTYRVGGEYDISDQAMVYALFATGYQPGTFGMGGTVTDAVELDQYTVGLKSRMLDSRLQLNVEGFRSVYNNKEFRGSFNYFSENFPTTTCGLPGQGAPGQATIQIIGDDYCIDGIQGITIPEMISQGVDVEINFLITENDRIDASAEYLKAEMNSPAHGVTAEYLDTQPGMTDTVRDGILAGLAAVADSWNGMTMQNSPEWSANFSYSHIFDMPNGSTLTPKLNMEYKSEYYSQGGGPSGAVPDPPESYQDAYQLYNFYLNWTSSDNKFNISAYVKNIEDKPIQTNFNVEGLSATSLLPPRTMGLVFSVKL